MINVIPFNIGMERMSDELMKYHISNGADTPWPFTPVIHHFTGPDRDNPHSHPFNFRSIILKGSYVERISYLHKGQWHHTDVTRKEGDSFIVTTDHIHQIIDLPEGECWTMIIPEDGPRQDVRFYDFSNGEMKSRLWNETEYK